MTQALILLISAMQLLTLVSGNPQLPQSFKDNVILIANRAISVAQEEINNQQQIVPTPTPVQVQEQVVQATPQPVIIYTPPPVVGGANPTPPPMPPEVDKSDLIITQTKSSPRDATNGMPFGAYSFTFSLLDKYGKYIPHAKITLSAPDNLYGNSVVGDANGESGRDTSDWSGAFQYVPTKAGVKTLTFSGGGKTKTIEIIVE